MAEHYKNGQCKKLDKFQPTVFTAPIILLHSNAKVGCSHCWNTEENGVLFTLSSLYNHFSKTCPRLITGDGEKQDQKASSLVGAAVTKSSSQITDREEKTQRSDGQDKATAKHPGVHVGKQDKQATSSLVGVVDPNPSSERVLTDHGHQSTATAGQDCMAGKQDSSSTPSAQVNNNNSSTQSKTTDQNEESGKSGGQENGRGKQGQHDTSALAPEAESTQNKHQGKSNNRQDSTSSSASLSATNCCTQPNTTVQEMDSNKTFETKVPAEQAKVDESMTGPLENNQKPLDTTTTTQQSLAQPKKTKKQHMGKGKTHTKNTGLPKGYPENMIQFYNLYSNKNWNYQIDWSGKNFSDDLRGKLSTMHKLKISMEDFQKKNSPLWYQPDESFDFRQANAKQIYVKRFSGCRGKRLMELALYYGIYYDSGKSSGPRDSRIKCFFEKKVLPPLSAELPECQKALKSGFVTRKAGDTTFTVTDFFHLSCKETLPTNPLYVPPSDPKVSSKRKIPQIAPEEKKKQRASNASHPQTLQQWLWLYSRRCWDFQVTYTLEDFQKDLKARLSGKTDLGISKEDWKVPTQTDWPTWYEPDIGYSFSDLCARNYQKYSLKFAACTKRHLILLAVHQKLDIYHDKTGFKYKKKDEWKKLFFDNRVCPPKPNSVLSWNHIISQRQS
jgi:hypothetical protein